MYVCIGIHDILRQIMDRPGKVSNPARGQS